MWRRALKGIESAQWNTAPFAADVFCNLAAIQAVQGKFDAALKDMRRAVERFSAAWNNLSLSLTEIDREGLLRHAADILAPDGILANVPFELLPDPEGGTLLERQRIVYLPSGRDLLKSRDRRAAEQTDAVVVADPAFDLLDESRPVSLATLQAFGIALNTASLPRHLSYYQPSETSGSTPG